MPTLNWIGKDKVVGHHNDVPYHVLEHQYGYSAEKGQTTEPTHSGNMIIHGDNLLALKSLMPMYEGRIKCIYIDPPYNTGNENWVYNDNVNDPHIKKWLGEVVGKEGEDLSRHDKWLCMMYPRLVLMKKLLSEDGAIFISIGDAEDAQLRKICDEIFGVTCFVANIAWQKTYSPRNDKKGLPTETEHLYVYGKNPNWTPYKLERTEEMDSKYKNPDNDIAPWTSSDPCAPNANTHQTMVYAIQHPFTGELLYPYTSACWRYQQTDMLNHMNGWCEYELRDINDADRRAEICGVSPTEVREGIKAIMLKEPLEISQAKAKAVYERGQWPKFYFTKGGLGGIRRKTYLTKVEGKLATNFWPYSEVGHTDEAKKEIKTIFEGKCPFETPKPTRLLKRIIDIATEEDSIILDCFAGSGTTGHAVLMENQQKPESQRKFIMIDIMDYAETVAAERIRRAISGYPFKGKKEEEIYSKKLTAKNILKAEEFLKEAESISIEKTNEYTKISKPKIADNCLKVIGTKMYDDKIEGLGGAFDYYELGAPLFNEDGNLNEEVSIDKIREYIYYAETKQPLLCQQDKDEEFLLDECNRAGYYFYYQTDKATTLSYATLANIVKSKHEMYIIYADRCLLDEKFMTEHHIKFKKIPRDIKRF